MNGPPTACVIPGLTSVIVPCLGRLKAVKRCLAALARHTQRSWELVAVTARSPTTTAAYLAGFRDAASFPSTVVTCAASPDAGAARDHGLAVAQGQFLVLLDERVTVTEGWLDQLMALAESDPAIGMTGPMSNDATTQQKVPDVHCTNLDELQRLAARWRSEHRGQWMRTATLDASCVLIKRTVLDALGGPGSGIGASSIGGDLVQRVRKAGYHPAVAVDLLVHRGDLATRPVLHPQQTGAPKTGRREPRPKVFGVGLPRTGTTSLAVATLELGLRTCHACFEDSLFDRGDAFFDTPVYTDYPRLDHRYPGSKFILTWREPRAWYRSFTRNLGGYVDRLRAGRNLGPDNRLDRRCYTEVFGMGELSEDALITRYHEHRCRVQAYFHARPEDLLVLDLTMESDPWDPICQFLGLPRPTSSFPRLNVQTIDLWKQIQHANKLTHEVGTVP